MDLATLNAENALSLEDLVKLLEVREKKGCNGSIIIIS
jgi:hypothetical protein